jgi:putative ABC transport system permease protein
MYILMNLMAAFGVLTILLSGILAANLISALLSQQVRQIGVMKTVGANDVQIMGIYFGVVLVLSVVALGIGIPLGTWAGRQFATFATFIFNFDILSDAVPGWVYGLEIATGLLVPLVAAIYPVYKGSRISVREAISDYGVAHGRFGQSRIDRALGRMRGLERPLMLSLRNTFRRRERLVLTLATLVMGGAVFMAALNVAAAWGKTIDLAYSYQRFDIDIILGRPYPVDLVEETLEDVPGVVDVEGWAQSKATRVRSDGSESNLFNVVAPPNQSELLAYPMVDGRWLEANDENALVITPGMLDQIPELKVGRRFS